MGTIYGNICIFSKSLVSFIQKLSISYEFNLGIDIEKINFSPDFKDKNNNTDYEKIEQIFYELIDFSGINEQSKKMKNKFARAKENKNIETMQKLLLEARIKYLITKYEKKWKIKLKEEFNISTEISKEKFNNPNFIEAYKMSVSPECNKKQITDLLKKYIEGEFDNISDCK